MEAIKCKGINFTYPKSEYPALSEVSFQLEKGEFCLLMGASAAGKSTLLKLLKKEIAPYGNLEGELEVNLNAGYVGQNVEENIVCDRVRSELSFGLTNLGLSAERTELLVAETASYFNLESKLDKEISNLSGGEKQIVNLAAVMVMKPEILILDEPCSQLDPVSAERFVNLIKKLHEDFGMTVLMSEHSTELLYSYADSIIFLEKGSLKIKDTPAAVCTYLKNSNSKMLGAVPVSFRKDEFDFTHIKEAEKDETPDIAVQLKNIRFAYEKGNDVLAGLDLKLYKNKINSVIGANASGKSTLLKVLAGVCKKQGGKIKNDLTVSLLTQNVYDLFTKEKCADEVIFGEITDFLGIDYIKNMHPYDLSGGEAQRLALAMVLERNADVILLDEPTKGFDAELKIKLAKLLFDLCKKGKTIVLVSHDIEFVGAYTDYCSFLSAGKIVITEPRREFFSNLSFYTTSLSRITNGKCVSLGDLDG